MAFGNHSFGTKKALAAIASVAIAMSAYAEDDGATQSQQATDAAGEFEYVENVTYRDKTPSNVHTTSVAYSAKPCRVLTSDMNKLDYGWYIVSRTVSMDDAIEICGDVHLIVGAGLYLGGSIHVPEGSTLHVHTPSMKDGYIVGHDYTPIIINEGKLEISDVELDGHANIGVDNKGTFDMFYCHIHDCTAAGVNNEGTFTLFEGMIYDGGRHGVENKGVFTMNGGVITKNRRDGVSCEQGSTTRLHGGRISDNDGAGVRVNGSIGVSGSPKIFDNASGDLYFYYDTSCNYFRLDGKLEWGANIGIKRSKNQQFTIGYSDFNCGDSPETYFHSNVGGQVVVRDNGELMIAG